MGRILIVVLGLGVVLGIAYYVVRGHAPVPDPGNVEGPNAPSAPKQTLDNVRKAANKMDEDAAKRMKEGDQASQQ